MDIGQQKHGCYGRRKNRHSRQQRARNACDAIADEGGGDEYRPGRNLPQRDAVHELFYGQPTVHINDLVLDKRDGGESSAESDGADAQKSRNDMARVGQYQADNEDHCRQGDRYEIFF